MSSDKGWETSRGPATHAYVGRHPICHHMRAAVIDQPGYEKETAKDVAEYIESGMRIERVMIQEVRDKFAVEKCEVCQPPKPKQMEMA